MANVLNRFLQPGEEVPSGVLTGLDDNPLLLDGTVLVKGEPLGPGGAFPLENTFFVEKGGNDSNDGGRADPFLTFQAAIDALGTPVVPSLVLSEGVGIFDENLSITSDNIFILAPSAIIQASSGDALTINASGATTIGVRFGGIASIGGNAINIVDASGGAFDCPILFGDITISPNGSFDISALQLTSSTITLGGSSLLKCNIIGSAGVSFADSNSSDNTFGRIGNSWYGTFLFNGRTRIRRQNVIEVAVGVQLTELHAGVLLNVNSGSPQNVTLPQESTLSLPVGWTTQVLRGGTGTVAFVTEGSDTIVGSISSIAAQGNMVRVTKVAEAGGVSTWAVMS